MLKGEHSAILSTFFKLPFVIKIFVLSIFEWSFYTGFTVHSIPARVLSAILAKSNMLPQLFNVVGINLSVTQFGYFAKVISIIEAYIGVHLCVKVLS